MSLQATLLVFLHCELKHLDRPWEPRHPGGTIISAIHFYKAWKAIIALQVDVSDFK
jgi:hypothetical protein